MKKYINIIFILIGIGKMDSTFAQTPIALFEIAVENNSALKALEQEYQANLAKAPQVSQFANPEINLGGFISPVETRLGAQRAKVSAMQMLPWFGTLKAKENVILTQAEARMEKIASQQLEVFYQIKTAWLELYEIERSQEIIQRNLTLLQSLQALTKVKTETGVGTLADVLKVDLTIQEQLQELLILEIKKRNPNATINQLLNRSSSNSIKIEEKLDFPELTFEKDSLSTQIQANHPIIRMFSIQQEAAKKAIQLNEIEGKPSFGLGMEYALVSPRTDAVPINNGRDILQIKASVSIPLYRKKYEAKAREEKFKIEALENWKEDAKSRFLSMIEKAFADYESAKLMLDLYDRQIATTKSALQILETEYSTNNKHFDELLRLETELIDYDLKRLKAIVKSQLAKAEIERYLGTL